MVSIVCKDIHLRFLPWRLLRALTIEPSFLATLAVGRLSVRVVVVSVVLLDVFDLLSRFLAYGLCSVLHVHMHLLLQSVII